MIEILRDDLTPLAPDTPVPGLEAGQDSEILRLALRNPGPGDEYDVLFVLQTQHPDGTYVSAGVPPQDELWCRVRVVGQDASGAPGQTDFRTGWKPLGGYRPLHIPNILSGGIRFIELVMRPPSSAEPAPTWRWSLGVVTGERSRAVGTGVDRDSGVLSRLGESSASVLLWGFEVETSVPPDGTVSVGKGQLLLGGELISLLASSHALDQFDGLGAALAAGEEYLALLSVTSAGVVVTKGARGLEPGPPPLPAGVSVRLLEVRVRHQAEAGSVIEPQDLLGAPVYDRLAAVPGIGRQVVLHPGQALGGGTWRFSSSLQPIPLEADATSFVWQLASGQPVITTSPQRPDGGAIPLWEADTGADAVTALRDRRVFAGGEVVLHVRGELPVAPGEIASLRVFHDRLFIERLLFRIAGNGGGSSGQTVLDLHRNADTVFTSQAVDDQRPVWAFDAAETERGDGLHEVTELRRGDLVTLKLIETPVGGSPTWAEVYIVARRPSAT